MGWWKTPNELFMLLQWYPWGFYHHQVGVNRRLRLKFRWISRRPGFRDDGNVRSFRSMPRVFGTQPPTLEGDAWTVSFWMSFCSSIMLMLDVFFSSSLHADTFWVCFRIRCTRAFFTSTTHHISVVTFSMSCGFWFWQPVSKRYASKGRKKAVLKLVWRRGRQAKPCKPCLDALLQRPFPFCEPIPERHFCQSLKSIYPSAPFEASSIFAPLLMAHYWYNKIPIDMISKRNIRIYIYTYLHTCIYIHAHFVKIKCLLYSLPYQY